MRRARQTAMAAALVAGLACSAPAPDGDSMSGLDPVAEGYVRLVLAVGQHDGDYVDAYYGPGAWREEAESEGASLPELAGRADALLEKLSQASADTDELSGLRKSYLETQLRALQARVAMLDGERLSFDEESRRLYDAVAPAYPEGHFAAAVERLDAALPGEGTVPERLAAFRAEFVIPPDRLDAVFQRAIDACRERTRSYIELPEGESFRVEYVTDKAWSAYNWYQGDFHSLIQVNTDLPIYIDRAIDLACHEGYPGHHVYNVLLEKHLVRDRGWPEFSVYPLFSPQSLIAEGTANYGIRMAFPDEERVRFEAEELFPLAGLDPARAAEYYGVMELMERLSHAGNDAARGYLDGAFDAEEAARRLERFAQMAPERARQRVRFIDQYRAYVINYNLGQDLVAAYVEGKAEDLDGRWRIFSELLSSPRLPSGLGID